ncbi:N-formylglutamate amidohydrolase [Sphingomonas sp. RP10(2022)]|uniref:N-formylglutamate amidohydrolase n=1 Tax=Sphingomonas liriopis TaxID=2949094 RepID=A0A9X2HYB5_9SPHN|nr:N-formylglutamate amidohydrolase [Sphingomonas liriopis]MCP3735768.1 N-formylglutamate amidohydrolase [Sphingomonas liriopis]
MDASFERIGAPDAADAPFAPPLSPVVLSVPHAGRDYPAGLLAALRLPPAALVVLEDRHVDAVAHAARTVETMLVQRAPRAWIDLNRSEHERDPRVDEGARPQAQPAASAKLRSGLGLVPRRAGSAGDLWRRRFSAAEVTARIAQDHRPYHDALAATLVAARARFGIAVLIDVHSMPPIGAHAQVVLGDRFGQSSAGRFVARLEAEAAAMGITSALNTPYAGGHILERHAAPAEGVHAIQLEIDRSLYLDHRLDQPGPGFARTVALLRRMLAAVEDEALAGDATGVALAAE